MNANILVTGGAGYVGSHICLALAQAGYNPVVYDNLCNGHKWAVKWGPFENGDLFDSARLELVFKKYSPAAVIHMAAFAYVGESILDPGKYYWNNVGGTLNLLKSMVKYCVNQIVFSSSCAVYGVPANIPIKEDCQTEPVNPYGKSKLMVERIIEDFCCAHGLRATILRYFNAAGAVSDGMIGEVHEPEPHLIPSIFNAVSEGRNELSIYGADYETFDGTCIRDYIHVTDLAQAHILSLKNMINNKQLCTIYNLGIQSGFSVKEIISSVEKITGRNVPHKVAPRRPGDPPILIADSTKATTMLGWTPKVTNIETIIADAWNWHCKYKSNQMTL